MESGANPEQVYPYCDADEGSEKPLDIIFGKVLPEEEAKPGYILIKTGLWEEAQVHILIVGIIRIPLFPRRYFANIEIECFVLEVCQMVKQVLAYHLEKQSISREKENNRTV